MRRTLLILLPTEILTVLSQRLHVREVLLHRRVSPRDLPRWYSPVLTSMLLKYQLNPLAKGFRFVPERGKE